MPRGRMNDDGLKKDDVFELKCRRTWSTAPLTSSVRKRLFSKRSMPTEYGIFWLPDVMVILYRWISINERQVENEKLTFVLRDNHNFQHDHKHDQPNTIDF